MPWKGCENEKIKFRFTAGVGVHLLAGMGENLLRSCSYKGTRYTYTSRRKLFHGQRRRNICVLHTRFRISVEGSQHQCLSCTFAACHRSPHCRNLQANGHSFRVEHTRLNSFRMTFLLQVSVHRTEAQFFFFPYDTFASLGATSRVFLFHSRKSAKSTAFVVVVSNKSCDQAIRGNGDRDGDQTHVDHIHIVKRKRLCIEKFCGAFLILP